jgi:PAS domain-containing protein
MRLIPKRGEHDDTSTPATGGPGLGARRETARHGMAGCSRLNQGQRMWVDGRRLFTGMLADISERKAMLEQLELTLAQLNTREQRLHSILDNTAEGIITFDEQGVIEVNQSAEKLLAGLGRGHRMSIQLISEAREIRDDYSDISCARSSAWSATKASWPDATRTAAASRWRSRSAACGWKTRRNTSPWSRTSASARR